MSDRLELSYAKRRFKNLLEKRLKSLKLDSTRFTIEGDELTLFSNDEKRAMVLSVTLNYSFVGGEEYGTPRVSYVVSDCISLLGVYQNNEIKNKLKVGVAQRISTIEDIENVVDGVVSTITHVDKCYAKLQEIIQLMRDKFQDNKPKETSSTQSTHSESSDEGSVVESHLSQYLSDRICWLELLREIDSVWKSVGTDRQSEVFAKDQVSKITLTETVGELKYKIRIYSDGENYLPGCQRVAIQCEMFGTSHHQFSHDLTMRVGHDTEDTLYESTLQWVTEVSERITRPNSFAFESSEEAHWRFIQSSFNYLLFK